MTAVSPDLARKLPKILLHDHLDGGLRPATILELADEIGHNLPSNGQHELVEFFRAGANSRDILQYLATFEHTLAVLQTPAALHRVAREAVEDLANDGVIYAEVRFAPELHPGVGDLDAAIEAVTTGFAAGMADFNQIRVNTIVCAMRTEQRSAEVADAAVRWSRRSGSGVVAFDLAGAETGFPPSDHADALAVAAEGRIHITIHASEPPGIELIVDALACGAERIGHGVRLIEDCSIDEHGALKLGPLAVSIRDREIPLELCPSCNVQIGAVPTIADHPIGSFLRAGIKATVNTDNRLMSGVTVSSEVAAVARAFNLSFDEVEQMQHNAAEAAFDTSDCKTALHQQITAGFASHR